MARLLVMTERHVDDEARESYLHSLSVRRASAKTSGANFWAFERVVEQGHFLEFTEAASVDAMLSSTPNAPSQPHWREVEGI